MRFPRIWCLAGLSKSFPHANNPPCFYDRLRRLEQGGHADQELTNKDIDDDRTAEYALEIMDLGVQVVVCQIPLFPLNCGGRLRRDVVGDAVDAGDFGHDAA